MYVCIYIYLYGCVPLKESSTMVKSSLVPRPPLAGFFFAAMARKNPGRKPEYEARPDLDQPVWLLCPCS